MTRGILSLCLMAPALAALGAAGCRAERLASAREPSRPADEVWISASQMKNAKIEVSVVQEQDVENTILTSGKVTFDDAHVTHVFAPLAGRVVRIDAQLGQQVRKGEALAVIESPDIGIASSDAGKAQADLTAAEREFKRQKELFALEDAGKDKDMESITKEFLKYNDPLGRLLEAYVSKNAESFRPD